MAETGDTGANLRRIEAALERIAQAARRRPPAPSPQAQDDTGVTPDSAAEVDPAPWAPSPVQDEAVLKIDEIIGGLRNALGIERDR